MTSDTSRWHEWLGAFTSVMSQWRHWSGVITSGTSRRREWLGAFTSVVSRRQEWLGTPVKSRWREWYDVTIKSCYHTYVDDHPRLPMMDDDYGKFTKCVMLHHAVRFIRAGRGHLKESIFDTVTMHPYACRHLHVRMCQVNCGLVSVTWHGDTRVTHSTQYRAYDFCSLSHRLGYLLFDPRVTVQHTWFMMHDHFGRLVLSSHICYYDRSIMQIQLRHIWHDSDTYRFYHYWQWICRRKLVTFRENAPIFWYASSARVWGVVRYDIKWGQCCVDDMALPDYVKRVKSRDVSPEITAKQSQRYVHPSKPLKVTTNLTMQITVVICGSWRKVVRYLRHPHISSNRRNDHNWPVKSMVKCMRLTKNPTTGVTNIWPQQRYGVAQFLTGSRKS